ncbi:Alkaline shock protein 23 [Corynebacterium glaucum]|uniref:Alkaline shock protein 23 n=1 Tax=Corynebacterium glaucum TaxID=187491 RepID=A0A1Q2HU81_9CORY|nr:Asp23/Gls24 family envelope stress response protein [Corynebacterium glaucum]AQQ14360.1 Alkaline shock protein 23 [Corynebacterium glaucum]WJZ06890.1 Alkaline shock protein 23 [Corynebacterium glaucum]
MADNNVRQNTPATPNTVNEQSKSNPASSSQANNPANNPVNNPADSASTSSAVEPEQIRPRNENLETDHGTTVIDDNVVGKIAGIAAREVSGVNNLGGGAARMWGAVRDTFTSSTNVQQGVNVAVQEGHVSVAVAIIAEYGVAIHELANAIRENVTVAITRMTGLIVDRVDVTVHDVHLPEQEQNQVEQYDEPANYQASNTNPQLAQ